MPKAQKLYKLTPGDKAIIQRARRERNPNIFFNYYLRSEESGTWWRPVDPDDLDALFIPEFQVAAQKWDDGYKALLAAWQEMSQPDYFIEVAPGKYEPVDQDANDAELARRKYRTTWQLEFDTPVFHHNHGFLMLPWQLEMFQAKQKIRTVVGGFGSGKSMGAMAEQLYYAATLPGYKAFGLAPYSTQADELHSIAYNLVSGTLYEERFVLKSNSKPYPVLLIGNDYVVGKKHYNDDKELNGIEFYPILDNTRKLLTKTIDAAVIDQAEQLPDVDDALRNVTTRFRGMAKGGRERLRIINFIANSGDSPTLWDLYDESETDPKRIWAASPGSPDNVFLGIGAMLGYQKDVGRTADDRRRFLFGGRPLGDGEHFPQSSLEKCRAAYLDDYIQQGMQNEEEEGVPDDERTFVIRTALRVGVHTWETPPQPGHTYVVVADPGWGNPPDRNSAGISVWDITGFPTTPAVLVAFDWTFGHGSPNPWITKFSRYVHDYKAVNMCRYDGTGFQKGYEYMGMGLEELGAFPVSMAGQNKFTFLTHAKKIMADGKLAIPNVPHIFSQLARYVYPEPKHLRQDLVSMLLVLASILMEMYYVEDEPEDEMPPWFDPNDRYGRTQSVDDRYRREHARR